MNWLAQLEFPEGTLDLGFDWTWMPSTDNLRLQARADIANADPYIYSPADGQPGAALALRLARELEATRVILPPLPPARPGVVY